MVGLAVPVKPAEDREAMRVRMALLAMMRAPVPVLAAVAAVVAVLAIQPVVQKAISL
jgi:hypothetical protein